MFVFVILLLDARKSNPLGPHSYTAISCECIFVKDSTNPEPELRLTIKLCNSERTWLCYPHPNFKMCLDIFSIPLLKLEVPHIFSLQHYVQLLTLEY